MLAKIKSTILILTALVALSRSHNVCNLVAQNVGDLPIACKSYRAPNKIGSTISSKSRDLSVTLVSSGTNDWKYQIQNNVWYPINFGVQFYNTIEYVHANAWETHTIDGRTSRAARTYGEFQNDLLG